MFRELEYQSRVFKVLEYYLEHLAAEKEKIKRKVRTQNPDVDSSISDFTKKAWEAMRKEEHLPRPNISFSSHEDGAERPVPNATLKVPTGGGKTWLAVKSASIILNKYLNQNKGFILWIVPNEAIYSQTLKNFEDRTHPYRQVLDRAAAGRVKILTKTDRLNAADVETHLCIMVLMLQSANRQTKETLRMFRERGDVHGFFPPESEQDKQWKKIKDIPNLEYHGGGLNVSIMDSLGNALRIIRPVVVMDEGHKATSDLAYQTLYDFNPSFVLELTATPKNVSARGGNNPRKGRNANLLVEITGQQLDREGMIKMPLIIHPYETADWKTVLNAAVERLKHLKSEAEKFKSESNRYIRPILLVQVERTGKDQRDGDHIHVDDVYEYLLQIGFDEKEIAIKTAEQNDLNKPENQNLLSSYNQVRVIITKEALQEGWDCPFAYVLCSLATRNNIKAMTQLVGRILRQPYAEKTDIEALDQCYVFTHKAATHEVVGKIKDGLVQDGLGDLMLSVSADDTSDDIATASHTIHRRDAFKELSIFLPQVLISRDGEMKPLDYETDILTHIDWSHFDHAEVVDAMGLDISSNERQLMAIGYNDGEGKEISHRSIDKLPELANFDPVQIVRQINDIVLNPFVAWELVDRLAKELKTREYNDRTLGFHSARLGESLRKALLEEQDKRAEDYFRDAVKSGTIQFRLRADGNNWIMPKKITASETNEALQMQKSLFERVYKDEMNEEEQDVAVYLDEQAALKWWHRNAARRGYGLKGWKKNVIYPDLIFLVEKEGQRKKLVALETKGAFLDGTMDTEYKRALMKFLTENFDWDKTVVGHMDVYSEDVEVRCDLVLLDGWKSEFEKLYFNQSPSAN